MAAAASVRARLPCPSGTARLALAGLLSAMHVACGNGATLVASDGASDPQAEVAARPDAGAPVAAQTPATVPPGVDPTLDVNQFLSLSTDNTASAAVALGTRYGAAARVAVTAEQKAFLASPAQSPSVPSSGPNSDLAYRSFDVTLYPSNGGRPSPQDVMQHVLDNCDGVAAFAALAYGHANYLQNLIRATGANTWNVSAFAPDGQPITIGVNNRFVATADGKLAAVSGRDGAATWATVLEKALMKYNAVYRNATSRSMGDLAGIGSETTLPMLTSAGTSYAFDRGVLTPTQLRDEVRSALDGGMMVTGGFGQEQFVDGYKTVTSHAYTLLWPKDDATMVSMRNPWGLATSASTGRYDGTADGVINVPLDAVWAATIDLRIMAPGLAGRGSRPAPYVPQVSRLPTPFDVQMLEQAIDQQKQYAPAPVAEQ